MYTESHSTTLVGPFQLTILCGKAGRDHWRASSPNSLLQEGPLEHATQDYVLMVHEYLQGSKLHNISGQPIPMLSQPSHQKSFPYVHVECPVFQFLHLVSHPNRSQILLGKDLFHKRKRIFKKESNTDPASPLDPHNSS